MFKIRGDRIMARQTFFSFRYKKDNWRAGIVRNSWVTQERKASGFLVLPDFVVQ
jgi:hypothetical protein